MDDDAVTDDAIHPGPKDAGWDQRQLVDHAVDDDRVTRVGPPLIAHDRVVLVAEQVNNLPLGLVSPLEPHHTGRRHEKTSPIRYARPVGRFGWQRNKVTP